MPIAGADTLPWVEGRASVAVIGLTTEGPPGSKTGARAQGLPRNLGDPVSSVDTDHGAGVAEIHPHARRRDLPRQDRERTSGRATELPSKATSAAAETGSRSVPLYRRSWGTDPSGPSGGKGAP